MGLFILFYPLFWSTINLEFRKFGKIPKSYSRENFFPQKFPIRENSLLLKTKYPPHQLYILLLYTGFGVLHPMQSTNNQHQCFINTCWITCQWWCMSTYWCGSFLCGNCKTLSVHDVFVW